MRKTHKNILTKKIIERLNDSPITGKTFLSVDEIILASAQISLDVIEDLVRPALLAAGFQPESINRAIGEPS